MSKGNCQSCGCKTTADLCEPCKLDLEEMEARASQQFYQNIDALFGHEFYDLPIDEKRSILGVPTY